MTRSPRGLRAVIPSLHALTLLLAYHHLPLLLTLLLLLHVLLLLNTSFMAQLLHAAQVLALSLVVLHFMRRNCPW
jgi:hypothetical protein